MMAIGADPGINGAIALNCSVRGLLEVASLPACAMPGSAAANVQRKVDARRLREIFQHWSSRHDFAGDYVTGVIERMRPFGQSDRIPAATLLSLGYSAGVIEGVLAAFTHQLLQPYPAQWKRQFGLASDKKASVLEAQRRYPQVGRISHDRAEAVLLSLWGLGQVNGAVMAADPDDPFARAA